MANVNVVKKHCLNVEKIEDFTSNMKSKYMTSVELCEVISKLFNNGIMEDYIGCKIKVNDGRNKIVADEYSRVRKGPSNLYVDLYFKYTGYDLDRYKFDVKEPELDTSSDSIEEATKKLEKDYERAIDKLERELERENVDYTLKTVLPVDVYTKRNDAVDKAQKTLRRLKSNLENIRSGKDVTKLKDYTSVINEASNSTSNSISHRYMNLMSNRNSGTVYKVLPHAYEMLEEFMPLHDKTVWTNHTIETTTNMSMFTNREEIIVCITGLDLDAVVSKIYGAGDDNGKYEYACLPSTVIANRIDEFIIVLQQLDVNIVNELINEIGAYRNPSSFYRVDK